MEDNTSLMDAIDRGRIIPLCIGGPRRRTRHVETNHPWNLGINTSKFINIGRMNIKRKQKAYRSEDPHHTGYELKSRGRDSREGGRM
jgi:hypothetical protein